MHDRETYRRTTVDDSSPTGTSCASGERDPSAASVGASVSFLLFTADQIAGGVIAGDRMKE